MLKTQYLSQMLGFENRYANGLPYETSHICFKLSHICYKFSYIFCETSFICYKLSHMSCTFSYSAVNSHTWTWAVNSYMCAVNTGTVWLSQKTKKFSNPRI